MSAAVPPAGAPRVLAFHLGALGDFVISWPALGLLAAGPPPRELWLVGHPGRGTLVLPPGRVVDREAARLAPLFAGEPGPELGAWLRGFALAAVFAVRPPRDLLAGLARAGVPRVLAVGTRPPAGSGVPAGEWQVGELRARGFAAAAPPLAPRPPAAPRRDLLVVAPGSGGKAKRLAPELVGAATRRLADWPGARVLLWGPAEEPAYRAAVGAAMGAAVGAGWRTLAEPGLGELAGLLARTRLYLGADSGVSHLATALGAPTLAVFTRSDPRVWAPRGKRAQAVTPDGLWPALAAALSVRPDPNG